MNLQGMTDARLDELGVELLLEVEARYSDEELSPPGALNFVAWGDPELAAVMNEQTRRRKARA